VCDTGDESNGIARMFFIVLVLTGLTFAAIRKAIRE